MDLFLEGRKIYVFCICVGVTVCVCLPCCPEVLEEDLDDKNSVGHPCQPVWSGAHAAPLPLPFSACLSHFVQRNKKKIVEGEGPLENNIRHDRATVTGCSFTTPSM